MSDPRLQSYQSDPRRYDELLDGAGHVRNLHDVFYPRTGKIGADGKPETVVLPGYAGIFYDLLRDMPKSILEYALGGSAPMPSPRRSSGPVDPCGSSWSAR